MKNKIKLDFNLSNSEDTVILKNKEGVVVDTFSYINSIEGKSFERRGFKCEGFDINLEGSSINSINLNYTDDCYEDIEEEVPEDLTFSILFSSDEVEWSEVIFSESEKKLFMKMESNSEIEIEELKWFDKNNEEISSPFVLNNYFNETIRAEFVINEEIFEVESLPLTISPEIRLQISEIYPNLYQNEVEWIELYNYGDLPINLLNFYFADNKQCLGSKNLITKQLSGVIESKSHLVINKELNGVSLNDSGDHIRLCLETIEINDFIYEKSQKGKSISRKFENNKYTEADNFITSPTPLDYNEIIEEEITSEELKILTIKEAKSKLNGENVLIEGYVTSSYELLFTGTFFIQDETSGIRIYFTEGINVPDGTKVRVYGKLSETGGNRKLNAVSIEILNKNKVITPFPINNNSDLESLEGSLVFAEGIIINNYSTSFDIQTVKGILRVSILSASGIEIGNKSKGDYVKVQGILSQDKDKYRILPFNFSQITILNNEPEVKSKASPAKKETTSKKISNIKGVSDNPSSKKDLLGEKLNEGLEPLYLFTVGSGLGLLFFTIVFRNEIKEIYNKFFKKEKVRFTLPRISKGV